MVNFGYGPGMKYWKDKKKHELAEALRKLLLEQKLTRNEEIEVDGVMSHDFPEPYIEVDGLYPGVRIRKITALTKDQEDALITAAEKIYLEIMTK